MADKLRVGIIGANPTAGWAARAHMPGMTAGIPGVELVAVSTTRQESADEAAKTFGARYAFDDHRRMLELDDVGRGRGRREAAAPLRIDEGHHQRGQARLHRVAPRHDHRSGP